MNAIWPTRTGLLGPPPFLETNSHRHSVLCSLRDDTRSALVGTHVHRHRSNRGHMHIHTNRGGYELTGCNLCAVKVEILTFLV